jgi:hypothetical protein
MARHEHLAVRAPVDLRDARLQRVEQAPVPARLRSGWREGRTQRMFASILKIARSLDLLGELPALAAWQQSILSRPAHVKAEQDSWPKLLATRLLTCAMTRCKRSPLDEHGIFAPGSAPTGMSHYM